MIDFAAYEGKSPEVARRQRCACRPICRPAPVICAKRLSRRPQGGIGVAESIIGMTLNSCFASPLRPSRRWVSSTRSAASASPA